MKNKFIDSHCHLQLLEEFKNEEQFSILIDELKTDLDKMLMVSISTNDYSNIIDALNKFDLIYGSSGSHPNQIDNDFSYNLLSEHSKHKKIIAIGETGLDYYRNDVVKKEQIDKFEIHIEVAKQYKKPVIIHTRSAPKDTLSVMKSSNVFESKGIIHCFTETIDFAKKALDMNCYISFSGIITFKNAKEIRSVVSYVPLDRLLIETDSPYLSPVPFRGKSNKPSNVQYVASEVANIKKLSIEDIAYNTALNFNTLFNL